MSKGLLFYWTQCIYLALYQLTYLKHSYCTHCLAHRTLKIIFSGLTSCD